MATLNQIAERVAIAVGKEENIAFLEAVKFSFKHYRAVYIRRDIERNEVSDGYLQRVTVPVEKKGILTDIGSSGGPCIGRTVDTIPEPVRLKSGEDFKFVGSLITGEAFHQADMAEYANFKFSRSSGKTIIAYDYVNGYIELYGGCGIDYVTIRAAFVNPEEVNNIATSDTCITDEVDFPCPADIIALVVEGLINGELKLINNNKTLDVNESE